MKTTFWDTDLDVLEASFLPKGKKITDLNVSFDARVPVQGSVLLERMVNVDQTVKSPSLISRLIHSVFKRDHSHNI
jgi:hypothetical protein